MKRFILLAAGALALAAPGRAQTPSVIVGVGGELSEPVNSEFYAPVFADMRGAPSVRLGSYTVRLTWNPAVLQYEDVQAGTFAEPRVQTDSTYYGVLLVAGISIAGLDGVVDLFRLKLKVLAAQTSAITIQVKELSAAGTFTDLLSAVTIVNGAFCPATGRWGDLDRDGFANSRDALAILSSVVGLPVDTVFHLSLGDVNGDGKTNSLDALIILSYAVGIEIPGQRVLLAAPGACGAGVQASVTMVPDTVDVVVGQRARLKAQVKSASGALLTLAVNWNVLDPNVAVVDEQGLLTGRAAGTTRVIAALGPGIRFSAPVIVRARRIAWYVNAVAAKRAPVQLGTQRWPFSTPQRAFPYVSEGDTIHILPGLHDYEDYSEENVDASELTSTIYAGVIVQGDTLPDGTRPVLRAPANSYTYGFDWEAGGHAEIRDLILRGFYYHVYAQGLTSLTLQNVRVEHPQGTYGYGVYVPQRIDTLLVLKSEFLGDTTLYSSDAVYVNRGAKFVALHDSKFTYWGDAGFEGYDVDSLDVLRSEFNYNDYTGIYLSTSYRPSVSARISQSRFLDNYYEAIRVYSGRAVALDHNYILHKRDDGVQVSGVSPTIPGSKLTMFGDSIRDRTSGYYWIDASALDSVLIDSLWLESPRDTAQGQNGQVRANYVRLTRSKLQNIYSTGIYVYTRKLDVDTTQFTGCAAALCTWNTGTAIYAQVYNDSGPAVSVTRSSFSNLSRAVYAPGTSYKAGPMVLTRNSVDSVSYGFEVAADSVLMTDNVLARIQYSAIYAKPSLSNRPFKTAAFLRNSITCSTAYSASYGIHTDYAPARVEDNAVRNCAYGIYGYNYGYPLAAFRVRRDTVVMASSGNGYGIDLEGPWADTVSGNKVKSGYQGIRLYSSDTATVAVRVDSNAVSGTGYVGLYVYMYYGAVTLTGVRNRIANNLQYGIYDAGFVTGARSYTAGAIYGNPTAGVYNSGPSTLVATDNWWGNAGGPGVGGANTVSSYVNAGSPKGADPGDVPPLLPAPPFVADATATASPALVVRAGARAADDLEAAARRTAEQEYAAREAGKRSARAERERARREEAARVQQAQAEREARRGTASGRR